METTNHEAIERKKSNLLDKQFILHIYRVNVSRIFF